MMMGLLYLKMEVHGKINKNENVMPNGKSNVVKVEHKKGI